MAFVWSASLVAGTTRIQNDSTGVIKELKDNIQSLYTSLSLGTVTYSQTMTVGTKIETVDLSEIRTKVDFALDRNTCVSNFSAHNATYKNGVQATHNASYYSSHRSSHYGSDNGTYNSGYDSDEKGTYYSATQSTHLAVHNSVNNSTYYGTNWTNFYGVDK